MLYLSVGAIGFFWVILYDLAQIRGRTGVAKALSSIGYLCISASLVFLLLSQPVPKLLSASGVMKALLAAAFFLLLVYSVLFEVPLALKRREAAQSHGRRVVSAGFYGIVRHPGFIWFALLWASIIFLYMNPMVTKVGVGLVALDFGLVLIEDRVFFPRIFEGYEEYRKRVPFLIPHRMR